ncbi:MAG: hypothetical protein WCJ51_00480 [Candidatus Moraniibacteriota bacterium]
MKIKNKNKRFLDIEIKVTKKQNKLANILSTVLAGDVSEPVLYSRGKKTKAFFTEDSKLYITPKQAKLLRSGVKLDLLADKFDGLSYRVVRDFVSYKPSRSSALVALLEKRYALMLEQTTVVSQNFLSQFSLMRLWNLSIVGSILFGMVTMTFVYKYLGQGVSAADSESQQRLATIQEVNGAQANGMVLGLANGADSAEAFSGQVAEIQTASDQAALEKEIYSMVKGHPIEKMVPYIAKQDRAVAVFFVAIAKKESNWGEHVPVLEGKDCYNYVGYRGQRDRMGTGGHTCFDSPQDAVDTVAKRIKTLVKENERDTAAKMVVWKCGSNCEVTGGQAAANKWIKDVDSILQKFKT